MDEKRTQPLNPCAEPHSPAVHSFRPPGPAEWFCDSCRHTVSGQHLCPGPDVRYTGLDAGKPGPHAEKSPPADTAPADTPPNENCPDPELELLAQDPKTRSDHPWHKKPGPVTETTEDKASAPDHFDTQNPRSVINLLPPKMKIRALNIPVELRNKTASQLQKLCNQRWTAITSLLLDKLRIGFWLEYNRVQEQNLPVMKLSNIFDGLCSAANFTDLEPLKLAFVLTPPTDYVISMETILHKSTALLEEALEHSPVQRVCRCHYFCQCKTAQRKKAHKCACKTSRGCKCPPKVDAKLLGVLLEVHKTVEMRLKGAVVQRVKTETTSKNLHVHKNLDEKKDVHPALTVEDIDKRIAEIRAKSQGGVLALPMAQDPVSVVQSPTGVLTPEVMD